MDRKKEKRDKLELKNLLSLTAATLESIHNGILVISSQRAVLRTNRRFTQMWHIPDDILKSGDDKTLLDFVISQVSDPEAFINKVEDLYKNPEDESFDQIYFRDGRIFERISKPMYIGGKPQGRVWSFLDITERKLVEEALHQERDNFRHSLDYSPLGIRVSTIEGNTIYANRTLLNYYGYQTLEELQNTPLKDRYTAGSYIQARERKRQRKRGETGPPEYEISIIRKNGEIRYLHVFRKEILWDGVPQFQSIYNDITERKQAEDTINHERITLRTLIDNLPTPVTFKDSQGRYILNNLAHLKLIGAGSQEEVTGKTTFDFFPAEEAAEYDKDDKYIISTGQRILGKEEKAWNKKTGQPYWHLTSKIPLFGTDSKITNLITISHDITQLKLIEEELKKNQAQLMNALKIAHLGSWEYDVEKDLFIFNDSFYDIFRTTAEQVGGYTMKSGEYAARFVHPDDKDLVGFETRKAIETSDPNFSRQLDHRIIYADGKTGYITVRFFIVKNEKGKTIRTFGVNQDITERRKAEKALRESEEKYRRIFENVQDMFFEMSFDGIINEVSPSVELISRGQYKREDVIGSSIFNFIENPSNGNLLPELMKSGFVTDAEIILRNRDGSGIPCSVSSRICLDNFGKPIKIIGSVRDITDRKNASDALKFAKEKAEAGDRLKTTFLNNISHEVRTPLNGILGFAEIMTQPDLSEEEKRLSVSMLFESSDRLLNTITNYMDISLITSGSVSLNRRQFLPGQILRDIFTRNKKACSAKQIDLRLDLPGQEEILTLNSDPEILKKVITHLLNNAIKFTEKGSISYGFRVLGKELEFFVKDTGIGIGKESLENIFEHFVKEDRGPLKISEGSGLGLSISKGLVELLGGTIRVESESGKGSVFFFTIPADIEFDTPAFTRSEVRNINNQTAHSILVAEDDDISFFYLKALLRQNTTAEIIHAANGREALEKFQKNPHISLILMDIKMPVMDGLEATRHIKALGRNVPVIAITAYAMSGDETRIIDAGCDCYITKPIDKKLLLEKISVFLKN